MKTLVNAFKKSEKLNILGFCFGHQSLAYHFGGRVIKMPQQIVHLENIKINLKKLLDL
jgi:anthranilate/para-aminobenzoate synthase component II